MAADQRDESSSSDRCACCQKASINNCGGCLGAPVYDHLSAKRTFYCDTKCQKADWDRHKTECKALQARKSLQRAAMVLQATMCRIRKNAYPLSVTSARYEGSKIVLDGPNINGESRPRRLQPFPAILENDRELLEAVLLRSSSAEAMVYLYSLTKELFD